MSDSLSTILAELERLAVYQGPWKALRDEQPRLVRRVAELREREEHLDDLLVVALAGGSGVGKSTLLNAIAGDQIAETSEMRPCTTGPVVYHPPGAALDFQNWHCVPRSALEHLVLIDTPDSDTIVHHHRSLVDGVLVHCDLILLCGSPEKYLDDATWSLLRPLRGQRTMVCVETKAAGEDSISAHWLARLEEQDFQIAEYFRVNALHTLDRKLAGVSPGDGEFDFPALEAFLRHELTKERIARIKRANVAGLLTQTAAGLDGCVEGAADAIADVRARLTEADKEIARRCLKYIGERLFAAPHLWAYALGRETSLRSKGFVGTLFRAVEAIRSLPARLPAMLPWNSLNDSTGQRAAALLTEQNLLEDEPDLISEAVSTAYRNLQSEVSLACVRAGFDPPPAEEGLDSFREELNRRLAAVMRGPARERVLQGANALTSWPVTLLADAMPLAFIIYSGFLIVRAYFSGLLLDISFFFHAATVLLILLGAELTLLSLAMRGLAWFARRTSVRDLRTSLFAPNLGFRPERALLETATTEIQTIERIVGVVVR